MKNICLSFFILLISFSFNSCKKKKSPIVYPTIKTSNLTEGRNNSLMISEVQENSQYTYHEYFINTDSFLLNAFVVSKMFVSTEYPTNIRNAIIPAEEILFS